jgi:hypothetical protein
MQAIVRDFRASGPMRHPDFEVPEIRGVRACPGMVEDALSVVGLSATPVLKKLTERPCVDVPNTWPQILQFDDWYQNKQGTNRVFDVQIPLYDTGNGTVAFRSNSFFPIDGRGFDDKLLDANGRERNFGLEPQPPRGHDLR